MKMAYLLQTVKAMPLGYDFRLYTYGPFDSDVLNDLGLAEMVGAVQSQIVHFPNNSGYGYEFSAGPGREVLRKRVVSELARYQPAIGWVLEEFGGHSAADLELITTIIYADREAARQRQRMSADELCRKVKEVKPRFTDQYIAKRVEELANKRLLTATTAENSVAG
jgi:hypothetical protein